MLVVEQWPRRRDACLSAAAAAAASSVGVESTYDRAAGVAAASAESESSHAAAILAWLADHNNMEARIVEQLVSLRPRITASTGSGIFAGQCTCRSVHSLPLCVTRHSTELAILTPGCNSGQGLQFICV